jgi:hypothetical protein
MMVMHTSPSADGGGKDGPTFSVHGASRSPPNLAAAMTEPSPALDPFAAVAALPGVAQAAASARAAVDDVLFQRVLVRRAGEVSAESALRGARASALLEGAKVGLADLRSGAAFDGSEPGRIAQAALRVSSEVGHLAAVWPLAPAQALARLHTVAAGDLASDRSVGRPRSDPSGELDARLSALFDLLQAPTAAPGVVVAAVVHGELLALEPFGSRDGLVARAAGRLTLMSRGVDSRGVTVPEVGCARLGVDAYRQALGAYVSATAEGVAAWVRFCCSAVETGAREGLEICKAVEAS